MTDVNATNNPIVVDRAAGETDGSATIRYEKARNDEFWEKLPRRTTWSQVTNTDLIRRVGTPTAETEGTFALGGVLVPPRLKPSETYEAGIFEEGHGPSTSDPSRRSYLKVFCVWKKPEVTKLIINETVAVGGTWYRHQIDTNVQTDIIMTGVSRTRPILDSNGIPHLQFPEGELVAPLDFSNDHQIEIDPLLPGNPYFFVAIVIDAFGNWEVKQATFTTLRRKLTVEFPTLHIFNDGDIGDPGEAEFWFSVYFGSRRDPRVIEEFHLPLMDIDDWSETDRPYSLGFAHVGLPQIVNPGQETISVKSRAREDDWPLADERAQGDRNLLLPTGRLSETVIKNSFTMDCPTTSGKFHYGVEVRFSVEYMP